jgi:hypothetical protein
MSNFTQYKIRFNNDTGIKADANIPLYILYIECIKNGITYNQYKSQFFNETGLNADGNKEIYLNWIIANFVNGGSGTVVHNDLTDRDADSCHPISAITGLQSELNSKANADDLANVATSGSYNDLTDTPTIPLQVNSDWNATSGVAEILNKPTIPSDVSELTDNTGIIPTATSDITNDSNYVADASYVHTDNNYTTTDKQTLADNKLLIDLKTDASKGLFFYDNFLYTKATSTSAGLIGLCYHTLNNAARSYIGIADTGYGKKRVLNLYTYTSATGDAMVNAILSVIPNYGVLTFETRIKIPILSVAAQRFVCYNGMQGGISSSPTDYIRFEYSDTINSGKFLCVSCVGGVTTAVDSGVSVVADTWYILKIVTNSDASSIAFYIDGNLVSTITTNIPSAVDLHTVNQIIKSVGTTQCSLYVDYVKCYQLYN